MNIGIVGHEAAKFTPPMEAVARSIIRSILDPAAGATVVSGGCHLGGIDIWAEEEARRLGLRLRIHRPAVLAWGARGGYKDRNLLIATECAVVHCIVVAGYHSGYTGMRFERCYHCGTTDHVKSGGCWTARKARAQRWYIIPVEEVAA